MIDAKFGINIGQEFQHGPTIFPGGVFPTEQFKSDLDYLWKVGIRRVRMGGNNANFQPAVTLQHQAVLLALEKGFDVLYCLNRVFGSKPSQHTDFYTDWLLPDAQWAQANGVQAIVVGNEEEAGTTNGTAGRDPITSMTRVSNVVTIVMPTKHNMQTGDSFIYMSVSTPGQSGPTTIGVTTNVSRTITRIDDYTFTFANTGTDDTTTVGWIYYTNSTVYKIYKRYATALKADGITIPLHYSCLQDLASAQVGGWQIATFVSLGRGDFDYVDLNIYGGSGFPPNSSIQGRFEDFKGEIMAGLNGFGIDHFMVTEWNLGADANTGFGGGIRTNVEYMMKRLQFLQAKGLKHYHFCWRFPSGSLGRLQVKNNLQNWTGAPGSYITSRPDDPKTFNDWWWPMIGQRAPAKTVGSPFINNNIHMLADLRSAPSETRWNGLRMNYGQSEQSGTYSASIATTAFNNMKAFGIDGIRVNFGSYEYTAGVNAVKSAALLAKSMGMHVIVGCSDKRGYGGSLDAEWDAYVASVLVLAQWAEDNGMDEFQVGNELDPSDTTKGGGLTDVVGKVLALGEAVKAIFSGPVSYAMAQDRLETEWIAAGSAGIAGKLDLIGYNVYGNTLNLENEYTDEEEWHGKINSMLGAFGPLMYISEFNLPYSWPFPPSEARQVKEIRAKVEWLITSGVDYAYFFTWSWFHANDQYALYKANGTFRSWRYALFQDRDRDAVEERDSVGNRVLVS